MKEKQGIHGSLSEVIELSLGLEYSASTLLGEREDSGDYVIEMNVDIIGRSYDEPDFPQAEVHLGKLGFSLIRVGNAVNDGTPLFSLFDVSQKISDLSAALYEPDYEDFKKSVRSKFPIVSPWDDILYVESIELCSFARGQRVGLGAMHRTICDWHSGCGLVVIQPHPLQYPNGKRNDEVWQRLEIPESCPDFKTSKRKLEKYYRQIGFEKVGRSDYMFRSPYDRQVEVDVPASIALRKDVVEVHQRLRENP